YACECGNGGESFTRAGLGNLVLDRRDLFGARIVVQEGEIALGIGGGGAAALLQHLQPAAQVVALLLLGRLFLGVRLGLICRILGFLVLVLLGLDQVLLVLQALGIRRRRVHSD